MTEQDSHTSYIPEPNIEGVLQSYNPSLNPLIPTQEQKLPPKKPLEPSEKGFNIFVNRNFSSDNLRDDDSFYDDFEEYSLPAKPTRDSLLDRSDSREIFNLDSEYDPNILYPQLS